jgi:ribosome-binding protein aMBF1 (putative translation factor)
MSKWLRHQPAPEVAALLARWSARTTGTIKRERARLGISQAELGTQIGLNQDGIKNMESHPELVPVERLFLALHALGLELEIRVAGATTPEGNE